MPRRQARTARALTRDNGRFTGANVNYTNVRTDTGKNVDLSAEVQFLKQTKGDMPTASQGLRTAQAQRNAEVERQRSKTRNGKGQYLSNSEKQRNARNARAKERYDIARAFGVNVG